MSTAYLGTMKLGAAPEHNPSFRVFGPVVDLDINITFSSATHRDSQNWQARTAKRSALIATLSNLKVGRKSDGDVWAPATFDGGQRKAAMALGTFIAPFDADSGHTADQLSAKFTAIGWYAAIIPSSSWGTTVSEIRATAYEHWKAGTTGDTSIERYLIDVLQKVPEVAKGAVIESEFDQIEIGKDGQAHLRKLLRIRHQPCHKYRVIGFLKERFDLSTPAGRRAWKRYYDAMCDVIGLPLDRTSGSPERLLYQSRLPEDKIEEARKHVRIIEGTYIDVTTLPDPLPRQRTRRGPSSFRDEHVHGRGADDDELEYHWIDPVTGTDIDLRAWAAVGMPYLELADILRDGDWPLDDRGEQDGKLHIECPFEGQHSSAAGGGTYVSNASDFHRTGMVDRQRAAVIHCSHHSCRDRDRLEFITELLRKGALTTAHLYAARDAAKAASLAEDFEPIEDPDNLVKPLIKPSFEWDRATIEKKLPQLKRLAKEDQQTFEAFRSGWDIASTIPADELDLLIDLAANDDGRIGPEPGGSTKKKDTAWRSKLIRTEKGQPIAGTKNLSLALEHGLGLGECVGYNLLKQRVEIIDPSKLGWGHAGETPRPWSDRDDTFAAALVEDELQSAVKPHTITPIIEAVAWKHAFHPVRDYLTSLKWDGKARLDRMLIDHADVENTAYARAVTARTLIGAVARAFQPGAKMDTALILESEQGFRKSSLFATLAVKPAFFTDNLPGHLGDKSVAEIVSAFWWIEMGELTNLKKGDVDRTKAFMSRTHDNFRPAYQRRVVEHPRQCVLTGTVNGATTAYLRDLTGNRRFWTLRVGRINLAAIAKERDQIWAEAKARYDAGEIWWLDDELEADLIQAQKDAAQERTEEPELAEIVRHFISHKPGPSGHDQDNLSAWTKRKVPLTVIPTMTGFFNSIGTAARNIKFSDKVAFKNALQALGWQVKQAGHREGSDSPIGLARGARFFVHPDAEKAGSLSRWLYLQVKRRAVAGMDTEPTDDAKVIKLVDHKDKKR